MTGVRPIIGVIACGREVEGEPAQAVKHRYLEGVERYARAVLSLIGLQRAFDAVYAIEHMGLMPKPSPHAFRRLLHAHRLQPRRCILVEDSLDNLRTARQLGMKTVWISRRHGRPAWVDVKLASVLDLPRATHRLAAT